MSELNFRTGDSIDLGSALLVCIPSKPKYAEVDLCIQATVNHAPLGVIEIFGKSLSFEEKKKLGDEIVKRWNFYKEYHEA